MYNTIQITISNAPWYHSYRKPMVKMIKKIIATQIANKELKLNNTVAYGN